MKVMRKLKSVLLLIVILTGFTSCLDPGEVLPSSPEIKESPKAETGNGDDPDEDPPNG